MLGGGSIGCELGQAFTRLGSTVTVVEAAARLLTNEETEAARAVHKAITADGTTVLTGEPVTAVEGSEVLLEGGRRIPADAILVAVGRRPDTSGLDLVAAGVRTNDRGFVEVDDHLRTTNPRIWAAGSGGGREDDGSAPASLTRGVGGCHAACAACWPLLHSSPRLEHAQSVAQAVVGRNRQSGRVLAQS